MLGLELGLCLTSAPLPHEANTPIIVIDVMDS